jgi:hypothetical protein
MLILITKEKPDHSYRKSTIKSLFYSNELII